MKISLVKNEHIMAYREGRLGEIPAELLVEVEEREKANKAWANSPFSFRKGKKRVDNGRS
jgi:hypothetical protein